MVWFKRILMTLALVVLIIAGLFVFFYYVPTPTKPDLSGEYKQGSIDVEGQSRNFSWYKPRNIANNPPLIFVLHGSNSHGEKMRVSTAYEFDILAETHGFIVVYPSGYKNHWNDCRASAGYAANQENIDDIVFFEEMIDYFSEQQSVDRNKVFLTGMSNGGHMAYRLGFESPELFKGIAAMAANLPVDSNFDCKKSGQPISIAIFNGTEDKINPYDGGLVVLSGNASRGEVQSSQQSIQYWLTLADIKESPTTKTLAERDGLSHTSVTEQRWQNEQGVQVRLYTLQGSGHVIPSTLSRAPRILGEKAGDISAAQEIVGFFLGLPQ